MPTQYLRHLIGTERSERANRHLAMVLAFVAGATHAGGYLAVRHYSSHMSGIVSSMADNLALGDIALLVAGFSAMLAFLIGAAFTAIAVNWGRRQSLRSEYVFPLIVEAVLLACFGLMGGFFEHPNRILVSTVTLLLCFTMWFQHDLIT